MFERLLTQNVRAALSDTPVVLLNGARQTGKTTLAVTTQKSSAQFLSFDDATTLAAAQSDPSGFVASLQTPTVLDEVQRVPELFPALKSAVDAGRRRGDDLAGRFLLTGSANVLALPKLSESLAGRMEILTLWPLSQSEIEGRQSSLVDALFSPDWSPSEASCSREELISRVLAGGYPEPLSRRENRRRVWFESYLTTILQRDVRDLANIEGLSQLPRLLETLAARTAGLFNAADVGRATGLPYATLTRYLALLEATFLWVPLPAWHRDLGKRLVKAPKTLLNDTGLAATLLGIDAARLGKTQGTSGQLWGALLENFVALELIKEVSWSQRPPRLFHFRTQTGQEIDIVLENARGEVVGVEVKASASVSSNDFAGLRLLSELVGDKFVRGLVLYSGDKCVPFGPRLWAVPIAALWL